MKPAKRTLCARVACVAALFLTVCACAPTRPLQGGRALTTPSPAGGLAQTLAQSDNPSQPSRQDQETIRTRTYTLPAGTRVEQPMLLQPSPAPAITISGNQNSKIKNQKSSSAFSLQPSAFLLPAPMPVTEREETRARTELGAAQKDTAHELGAKLSSLKGIVWVGVGLFVFGLATIFWAPLRAVVGSLTTSIAITLGGVALMVLPTLIVGNELLILGGVGLAVGAWFLAHRHGHLRGQLTLVAPRPPHKSSSPAAPKSDEGRSSSS